MKDIIFPFGKDIILIVMEDLTANKSSGHHRVTQADR